MQTEKNILMVFARQPLPGRCKTRLAAVTGHEAALAVYGKLLANTLAACRPLPCRKAVFCDALEGPSPWKTEGHEVFLQHGANLGEKMGNAFAWAFAAGYRKAVLIGTDCPEVSDTVLAQAFTALDAQGAVLGPAADGGYYLIGLTSVPAGVFENKAWGTGSVMTDTALSLAKAGVPFARLPVLHDIDTAGDLKAFPAFWPGPSWAWG